MVNDKLNRNVEIWGPTDNLAMRDLQSAVNKMSEAKMIYDEIDFSVSEDFSRAMKVIGNG